MHERCALAQGLGFTGSACLALAVGLVVVQVHLAFAVVSRPAQEYVERGYAFLAQAPLEAENASREDLLTRAVAAFKEAYQTESSGPTMQVHALLGAAQAYLLVQSPRRVFPFLWQATPLQRAEKVLQQAMVLQPDNAAAALLLSLVYWRQVAHAAGQSRDALERSQYYLTRATVLGIPTSLAPTPGRHADLVRRFGVDDTIVALRYVDARRVGRMGDLILVYQPAAGESLFGVVITERQPHPLSMDAHTGALAPHGFLEAITIMSQPNNKEPILVIRLRQGTQVTDARFTWDGTRFVSLAAIP